MARSKRAREALQNNIIARASATATAIANLNEHLVEEPAAIIAPESSKLATNNVTNTSTDRDVGIAAPTNTEYLENIDINKMLMLDTSIDADRPSNSPKKLIDGAPVLVQSADAPSADFSTLTVAAHPTSSPLESLDMNVQKIEKEIKTEGSISLMAVSVADGSDSDYASIDDPEEKDEAEDDSEAESALLLPEVPGNQYEVAAVRPPPIFVNNIEDYNYSYAKKPRLDLASFKTLGPPADDVAATTSEEKVKARPLARVSEEALASLSPTHIASDILKYFVRTRAPAFLQRFVAPAQAPEEEAVVAETAADNEETFGFGSPVDNIVREPAPWELTFGSPLEDASRPPAPWADAEEDEVDPLAVPLPDDEEIVEEKEEEWKAMVDKEWYEDVPTSKLDFNAMQKEWDTYCAERSQKVAAMLETEEKITSAEAKLEAAQVAFKELEVTASFNKRKLSSQRSARLSRRNLVQVNQSYDNVITKNYLNNIVSIASPIKHRFLEADYSQQVWKRLAPTGPGFGTGLGIALEYPTSENSQRDMRLGEDAAAQAMYYFENSCVEYARPPVQLSRDEVENMPEVDDNPAVFKRSGVILTRESNGMPFHCTVNRPPLDLAISRSRAARQGASCRKRVLSDVWKVPPLSLPPGENTLYYRAADKVKEVKQWIRPKLRDTLLEYNQRLEDAAVRIKNFPSDLVISLVLGI
ncbi:hypothetical protein KSW81_006712 [Nannochloris sp. 'desiccata']|nr:hypothetical protein KSW81_006712 [Chlorella desiccata (nom. nud.)]